MPKIKKEQEQEQDNTRYGVQFTRDALDLAGGDNATLALAQEFAQENHSTCITSKHVQNAILQLRPGSDFTPKPKAVTFQNPAKAALIAELKRLGYEG
jgi:hypothetical protein